MKKNIIFLGAGNIARALAFIISSRKDASIQLEFWDIEPGKVPNQKSLDTLASSAEVVFVCVNSWAIRDALLSLQKKLRPAALVVTVAKGIENSTGLWMHEVLGETLSRGQKFGLLSGPMLAKEILAGLGGSAVVAGESVEVFDGISPYLATPFFRMEYSNDVLGAAVCGVLKNIYAIALGIIDGLELGSNMKGWFAMQSIKEMVGLVQYLGGRGETAMGPAGFGDFIATGFSDSSKNAGLGREVAKTGGFTTKSEGSSSLEQLIKKIQSKTEAYPVLHILRLILLERRPALQTIQNFLR